MGSWSPSQPCPSCGGNGQKLKCENCGTLGCPSGNCQTGGMSGRCKICNKTTKKIKL